jgi:UDP-N-acetylmuramate dehydrogenase
MIETLHATLGNRLLKDESLARYTAARLGGPADWLYIARDSEDELVEVTLAAWKAGIPVRVLGGGANVLISDKGFRGLIIVNHISDIVFGEWHEGRNLSVTGGVSLTVLAHKCQSKGLSGMEWAVSVPGTIGGAVVTNAGAHGGDMAHIVRDVVVLEPKGPKLYTLEDMRYEYRSSMLKVRADRRYLVLLATLALKSDESQAIENRMQEFIAYRKQTQPPGASLGSIFKNPSGDYAGRLIEAAGLKGYRIGNVQVSPIHANFFVNTGEATASDYFALISHVRETVHKHSGVELEMEIELVGEWE